MSDDALEALRLECLAWALQETAGHIWQHQGFNLHKGSPPWRKRKDDSAPACLWGSTAFGDDVEDEWLVCWITLQLTRHALQWDAAKLLFGTPAELRPSVECRHHPVTAQIWDNDGSFLLIEAALTLPRWLKPEVADRRVWLHSARLHIIPLPSKAFSTIPTEPSISVALQLVRDPSIPTEAGPPLAAPAGYVRCFPTDLLLLL